MSDRSCCFWSYWSRFLFRLFFFNFNFFWLLFLIRNWSFNSCVCDWSFNCSWTFKSCWNLLFFCMMRRCYFLLRNYLACTRKYFWNNCFFTKSKIWNNFISFLNCIISFSFGATICIKISFEPLNKLQIILIFSFN